MFDLSKCFIEHKLIRLNENIYIISIYGSLSQQFLQNFELAVREILKFNTRIVVARDLILKWLRVIGNASFSFANLTRSLNLFHTNEQPTRIRYCIDNIILIVSDNLCKVSLI